DAREIGWRSLPHGDPLDALLHERQHAERQKVDLYEARVVAGILVPLAHHAVFHGGALERYDLHERPARDDHPAHVLRNVPWQPRDLLGELTQLFPERRAPAACESGELVQFVSQSAGPSVRQFRDLLDLAGRQIQRLADLAHRRAQAVGGKRADEPEALDEPQLLGEPPLRLAAVRGAGGIALFEPRAAQLGERPGGGSALGAVEVGKAISQIPREIELTAPLREGQSIGDSIWTVTK